MALKNEYSPACAGRLEFQHIDPMALFLLFQVFAVLPARVWSASGWQLNFK
jgi:hypothetical protein